MSSPLPRCAWCGQDLRRKARVLVRYVELPGKPEIGWHHECAEMEPCFDMVISKEGNAKDILTLIDARAKETKTERIMSFFGRRRQAGLKPGALEGTG